MIPAVAAPVVAVLAVRVVLRFAPPAKAKDGRAGYLVFVSLILVVVEVVAVAVAVVVIVVVAVTAR